VFASDYAPHALPVASPAGVSWIYVRAGSSAAPDPKTWRSVSAER